MRQGLPALLCLLACLVLVRAGGSAHFPYLQSNGATETRAQPANVIHVDDDASDDPGPRDPAVSDPREDGTASHPFDRIQEAIDIAANGASVLVHAGTYRETIDLLGKHITVTGFNGGGLDVAAWPVIDGGGSGPVVSFTHGEDANCILSGFVITGARDPSAGAVLCSTGSPMIAHCLIAGNCVTDSKGAAVYCADSNAIFVNCTITGNHVSQESAVMRLINSQAVVANSIIWGNTSAAILISGTQRPVVRFSAVEGGWPGPGCIDADPLFASVGYWAALGRPGAKAAPDDPDSVWIMGDYHLLSKMGRFDPKAGKWVLDQVSSRCIDAGDSNSLVGKEVPPNGGIINVGAYGGTAEASKSWSDAPVHFPDANLKAAVEQELWISDPTPGDMLGLTQMMQPNLYTRDNAIASLAGLEYAVNLQELNLRYHNINDISALSGLTNLHTVILLGNYVGDISPLSRLSNLRTLELEQNKISSISALAGLSNLESIGLHRNFVTDISPLANLTHLRWVDLRADPMNRDAYSTYLPRIQTNNPGVTLLYDALFTGRLVVSSTAGGSVARPGEGEFFYGFYELVVLEASADPGFEFVGWSGSYSTMDNPLSLTMDQDYELRANFRAR